MAQSIACDLCGQEPAVMLETRVETGEVIAVGAACLIPFYVGAAASLADTVDYSDGAVYAPMIEALAAKPVFAGHHDAGAGQDMPPAAPPVPGTEDTSVSGNGITATPDKPPAARTRRTKATP